MILFLKLRTFFTTLAEFIIGMDLKRNQARLLSLIFVVSLSLSLSAKNPEYRILRDEGKGTGIISQFGTNFGFFMPETGGYLLTGIICGEKSIWLHEAAKLKVENLNNGWKVIISDPIIGKGNVTMTVLPLSSSNGLVMEITGKNTPDNLNFLWTYGGCTARNDSSEKKFFLKPDQCLYNIFSDEINAFTVYYGQSMKLKVVMGLGPLETVTKLTDAYKLSSPLTLWNSDKKSDATVISATNKLIAGNKYYYSIYRQNQEADYIYQMLPDLFLKELTNKKTKKNEENRGSSGFGPDFHF